MSGPLGLEQRSLGYSVMLHTALVLIAAFGLPILLPKTPEPEPMVMTVDILPISAMTNVKPSDQPIEKAQKAPTPPTPKPVSKPAPAPPTPQEKAEEPKPFDPMEKAEEKPKPDEKKEEAKKEPQKLEDVLKNLQKESEKAEKNAKDKATTEENKTRSNAPYDDSMPLSISEKDAIKNQFIKCWRMPAGAKDPHSLAVRIHVMLKEDGSLISSEIVADQLPRYNSEPFFRAAADAAIRAVAQCTAPPMGPLKDLPPDKYGSWRDMELNFDPSELLY